jgi:mannose-6-phosphate isomerase-like protein (cupin superfamily)
VRPVRGYSVVHIDELEGEGPGGIVRKARRALGGRAFGFNFFRFPPDTVGREHDHAETRQEEVYFVVSGSGVMRLEGDEIELRPGTFVRVDPQTTRVPISGPEGLEYVVFGSPVEGPYVPPDWG